MKKKECFPLKYMSGKIFIIFKCIFKYIFCKAIAHVFKEINFHFTWYFPFFISHKHSFTGGFYTAFIKKSYHISL